MYFVETSQRTNFRNSIFDGIFAHVFATLTGGVFLTGFALYLGMDELMIGLLASMPFWVTVFQLPTSYFIIRNGERKKIAVGAAAIARFLWVPILLVALVPFLEPSTKTLTVLGLIFLSYVFISVSYVSWLSWMSDLVPDRMRGRFFGTRNMFCGASGMVAMVIYGRLLDGLKNYSFGSLPAGFSVTFTTAVLFGMMSLFFLKNISESSSNQMQPNHSFRKEMAMPIKDANFRRFLVFTFLWGFSVHFASPFFTLYCLRDLKFSYTFVAALGVLSAFADLMGMHLWGRISDRYKNKAVIQVAGWVAVFLPLAWVTVRPDSIAIPILLHVVGGGFWAGINLCNNNLLLRISPQDNRTCFLSVYNICAGLGAAMGPVFAGLILRTVIHGDFQLFGSTVAHPLQMIFVISTLLRLFSLQIFRSVQEPQALSVGRMVRMLRSIRGLNVATGFNHILHPFFKTDE